MLIKKLSRRLAFFTSMSWPGGDKVDLVTFKVRDSSPSCTRVSTPLSAKHDKTVNHQITEKETYVVPKSMPMTIKSSSSEFFFFFNPVTRLLIDHEFSDFS